MTKTFAYTFETLTKKDGTDGRKPEDWYWKKVTLTKKVTDKMEERPMWKVGYAVDYFDRIMRTQYGFQKCVIRPTQVKEI